MVKGSIFDKAVYDEMKLKHPILYWYGTNIIVSDIPKVSEEELRQLLIKSVGEDGYKRMEILAPVNEQNLEAIETAYAWQNDDPDDDGSECSRGMTLSKLRRSFSVHRIPIVLTWKQLIEFGLEYEYRENDEDDFIG